MRIKKQPLNHYKEGDIVSLRTPFPKTQLPNGGTWSQKHLVSQLEMLIPCLVNTAEIEILNVRPSMTKNNGMGVYNARFTHNTTIHPSSILSYTVKRMLLGDVFVIWDSLLEARNTTKVEISVPLLGNRVFKFKLPDVPSNAPAW